MPKIIQFHKNKTEWCTNNVFHKDLSAENFVYLSMVCNASLKTCRKLDKRKTEEVASGKKSYLQQTNSVWKLCP